MRETYKPPTTSPTGPPHDRIHPHHSRTLPRTPSSDVRARNHTHPRHSCAQPCHSHTYPHHSRNHPRHSREGGNPPHCVQTPEETALLPPSTKFDKNRQNSTRLFRNSCPHARARARGNGVPFPFSRHWVAPRSQRTRRIAWSCRLIRATPIHRTEPLGPCARLLLADCPEVL